MSQMVVRVRSRYGRESSATVSTDSAYAALVVARELINAMHWQDRDGVDRITIEREGS